MREETAVETPQGTEEGAPGKSAAAPATPEAGKEAPAPKTSGNKWTDLGEDIAALGKSKIGELGATEEPELGKKPAAKGTAAGDAEAEKKGEEELKPEGGEKGEGEEEGKQPKGEKEPEDTQSEKGASRYSVVAADGAEFEFEALPKGAKLVFNAAGRKLELTSLNDLVTLAQDGARLPTVEGTYQKKLATQTKTITVLTNRLKAADQAFREIVEDDEKLEEYRARATKLTDPEYREGLEAKRKLAAKEEQEAEEGEELQTQVADEFWAEAQNQFDARLEKFPTLDAEDYPDVVRSFWGAFQAHREQLAADALAEAGTEDLTKEQLEAVDVDAIAWLTENNFEAAMQSLHEKIERRSARSGGGNGRRKAATEEEAAKAEADAHNKHVDDKLRQRDTRTLKGKGAPPGRGGEREERPTSWQGHMDSIHEEFEKAKKPAVTD